MGQITQRQTALALNSIIFISLLIVILTVGQPENPLVNHRTRYIIYLIVTAVLWLLTWFNWRYARQATVAILTVMSALAIPESGFNHAISQGALLPPILAMVITGIPGVIGSALATWLILLWRSGGNGMYASPPALAIYALAISGLVLGRLVINARLSQERDLLQALMDNIPDHIYFKDRDSRFIRINRSQAQFLGIAQTGEAVGKTDMDFQPAPLSQKFLAEEQQMMHSGEPIIDRVEFNPAPDGRDRWLSATKAPIYGKNGRVIGLVGISRDVTERTLVEKALQKSEQNYREIFNATSDAIIIYDTQTGLMVDVNDRMLEMFGYSYDEARQLTINDLTINRAPYSATEALAIIKKTMAEGTQLVEWLVPRKNGELFWIEAALRGSDIGGHGRILATVRDISERKRAEESLRLSEERFAKAFRASGDGISISTLVEGRIIDINNAHTRIFGYTREEAIGQTAYALNIYADPASRDRLRTILEKNGEVHHLELKAQRKSGELFDGLFSAEVVNVQGELCIIGTVRDITPQKQAAAALQAYARELERSNQDLANFAYVASHDLQEPLRKIQTFSHRLLERYNGVLDERGQDYLRRVDGAAARMQLLIQDVLTYARIGTKGSSFSPVSLSAAVQDVLADLEELLEATRGQVIISELPTIDADPIQIRQLLQNLISNGLKFRQPDVPPVVQIDGRILPNADDTPALHLTITDNGIGFDEKYLPRMFTMFQRLHGREEYDGTGIGLAICRRIVERHNGAITAHSQPGAGATFIIELPIKQPPT
ncbi:MAG: PAS domain S-box protein [Anaerolineae bacterium]|nr:PAS domain S-box protein [Anaerolineae bacterium]